MNRLRVAGIAEPGRLPAHRDGAYYYGWVTASNGSGPAAATVTVSVLDQFGQSVGGATYSQLAPSAGESFNYDGRGNLTDTSLYVVEWDGADRLTEVRVRNSVRDDAAIPDSLKVKVVFGYDHQDRRTTKQVFTWDRGSGQIWNRDVSVEGLRG